MSRADLEDFLRGNGYTVDARTEINGNLQVAYIGSSIEDNAYDGYEITALEAVGHDTQPLAREVWTDLYHSVRWSPQEISVDNDPTRGVSASRPSASTPHNRAIIAVTDTPREP